MFNFILCIYFMTFIFYINCCQSPVSCFISYHSYLNFSLKAHGTVGGVLMVVVCMCLVGVGGGLYICLWGGGVGVKLMSVDSVF